MGARVVPCGEVSWIKTTQQVSVLWAEASLLLYIYIYYFYTVYFCLCSA